MTVDEQLAKFRCDLAVAQQAIRRLEAHQDEWRAYTMQHRKAIELIALATKHDKLSKQLLDALTECPNPVDWSKDPAVPY